jgi:hypothetical protein
MLLNVPITFFFLAKIDAGVAIASLGQQADSQRTGRKKLAFSCPQVENLSRRGVAVGHAFALKWSFLNFSVERD